LLSIRDVFNRFCQAHEQALHQTVVVSLGELRLIGFSDPLGAQ
jgi:hypothetical protein